jgi:UDP-glucose 4-epimerase
LKYLEEGGNSDCFNLGSGEGFSVKEVIEVCRKVTGHDIPQEIVPRREGDPAFLIATSNKAEKILGWTRKYSSLEKIIESSWKWHQSHPNGFE